MHGLFREAYQLGKLCDLDVAVIVYDIGDGQYHTCRSTDRESRPPSEEKIVSDPPLYSVAQDLMCIISLRISRHKTCSPRILKA